MNIKEYLLKCLAEECAKLPASASVDPRARCTDEEAKAQVVAFMDHVQKIMGHAQKRGIGRKS